MPAGAKTSDIAGKPDLPLPPPSVEYPTDGSHPVAEMAIAPPPAPQQLRLTYSPSKEGALEPRCYGSPAKMTQKKEVMRVQEHSACEQLARLRELQENLAAGNGANDGEAEGEEEYDTTAVKTTKKSSYMTEEVEEKLGLAGADPYGMLELEDRRWKASQDEIRKAYRRLVLQHHPDKKAAATAEQAKDPETPKKSKKKDSKATGEDDEEGEGEGEEKEGEEEDSEFKLLSAAYELLGNAERRRAFDSLDYFNDDLPTAFRKGKDFYRTFRGGFARQAKFSEVPKAPGLGDEETPYEEVATFYRFWQNLRSWRDFSLLTEHDLAAAEDREERRWMQRQNKNMCERIKKDEMKRVQGFVALAYENDPRVLKHKAEQAEAKKAAKDAKEEALRKEKEAKEAAAEAERAAEKAKQVEAEAAKAVEKEGAAASKREKEKQRSALKKARKELKALGDEGAWAAKKEEIDVLAAALALDELQQLHAALVGATNVAEVHGADAGAEAVAAMEAQLTADVARVMAQQ